MLLELLTLAGILLVAAVFTATNMFHYPNYELDEGTYVGSAWAMFQRGDLYYYTYAYDHPFGGWLQIGAFSELVGGFFSFGPSVNTGRVLMLVLTVISTLLVYLIVRRATTRVSAGLFAAVVFAVSPLGVSLHRQVYLDNLLTLWFLVSLYTLLSDRGGNLWRTVVSAIAFSLSFWSKEISLLFLPGMLYLVWALAHPAHRRFAITLWAAVVASATSLFVMLALLKDELLPPGVLWSSSRPHVSLLETYLQHAHEGGGSILSSGSDFHTYFGQWIAEATYLMVGGVAAVALGLLFWRKDKLFFGLPLLVLPFVLFLARGGVVRYFWVIPLLALLAIALGLLAGHAVNAAGALMAVIGRRWRGFGGFFSGTRLAQPAALAVLGLTVFLGVGAVPANYVNFHVDDTSSQTGAARWVAGNVPHSSVILTDSYAWADLRSKQLAGDKPFKNAHVPQTALRDPSVRATVLRNAGDIDYLLYGAARGHRSPWIGGRVNGRSLPLVDQARKNSDKVRTFRSGDWVMHLRRVRNLHRIPAPDNPLLANTWRTYKAHFMENGRVVDPEAHNITTSEGQAYAMQRAVYMDDQKTFDRVWGWSQKNLQVRKGDALLAWKYGKTRDGIPGVSDRSSATDADTDTALALLFAAKKFHNPAYAREARKMLDDIWREETTLVGSDSTGYKRVVVAGDWARGDGTNGVHRPVVNPSYLSPYAYKIFAAADPSHRWDDLVGSSYGILKEISRSPELGGGVGLVPDWVALEPGIDPKSGDPLPVSADAEGLRANVSSYDASRVPWRISLDYLWFGDGRALDALKNLSFPEKQIELTGRLYASYNLSGNPTTDSQALSAYAGTVPGLLVGKDPALAQELFAWRILGAYNNGPGRADAYWGDDPNNYYDQNMAWFTTAVMDGSMGNLYAGKETIDWSKISIDTSLTDQARAKESS